jgi:hypothetical protein
LRDFDAAADSLGHIQVTAQIQRLAGILDAKGDAFARRILLRRSAEALARRGVLPEVIEALTRQPGSA